jgi:hypothetical protein
MVPGTDQVLQSSLLSGGTTVVAIAQPYKNELFPFPRLVGGQIVPAVQAGDLGSSSPPVLIQASTASCTAFQKSASSL